MSDPDAMPDPIDKAYVEAEAVLNDDAAREARRARVLAAVVRQGSPDAAMPPERPRAWRRAGWLVAASVAGLALVVATQLYRPPAYVPPSKPAAQSTPDLATRGAAASAPTTAAAPSRAASAPGSPVPEPEAAASAAKVQAPAPPTEVGPVAMKSQAPAPPPVVDRPPSPPAAPYSALGPTPWPASRAETPPPPPPADAASVQAPPLQAANRPQARNGGDQGGTAVTDIVVTAEKRTPRRQSVSAAVSALAGRIRQGFDLGARLRAAAADGRTKVMAWRRCWSTGAAVDSADAIRDRRL